MDYGLPYLLPQYSLNKKCKLRQGTVLHPYFFLENIIETNKNPQEIIMI